MLGVLRRIGQHGGLYDPSTVKQRERESEREREPSAVFHFRGKRTGPFHTLKDPIFYIHTKFGKDISIGGGDMSPKRNAKNAP